MHVEFVIDELVLIGFDARDRHRIADALERSLATELARTPAERIIGDVAATAGRDTALRGPDVKLQAPTSPNAIAGQVSRSVFSALSGEGR